MSKKELYQVRSTNDPSQWVVKKVDFDFNPSGEYHVSRVGAGHNLMCDCFAGTKSTCRHRTMLPIFEFENKIDTNQWYNFDKQSWVEGPTHDA